MKKILTLMIAMAMCFALAACGSTTAAEYKNNTDTEAMCEPQSSIQVLDLIGPWHLDSEKNDLDAITAAWDTFPGYGEWGAGMEIQSDGFMSWYIGAVGGSGTYTMEGDILHAALTDAMEKEEFSMDFIIAGKDEIKMTYADLDIIWTYGDSENIGERENR